MVSAVAVGVAPVALHHAGAADADLARRLRLVHDHAVAVEQLHLHAGERVADGARRPRPVGDGEADDR